MSELVNKVNLEEAGNTIASKNVVDLVTTLTGGSQFTVNGSSKAIVGVEVIDIDLVLINSDGEKILLKQGGIQATTHPDTNVVFSDGTSEPLANYFKKVGLFKKVTSGSFRIQSIDTEASPAEKNTGHDYGIGKDSQDESSKENSESLTQLIQKLDQIVQINQSEAKQTEANAPALNALGKSNGNGVPVNILASPPPSSAPSAPPKKTDFTTNNPPAAEQSPGVNERDLVGTKEAKVSNVILSEPDKKPDDFSQMPVRKMLPDNPLIVHVVDASKPVDTTSTWSDGKIHTTFELPFPIEASYVDISLNPASGKNTTPPGFTINGQSLSFDPQDAGKTIRVYSFQGDFSYKKELQFVWDVAKDGDVVKVSDFSLNIKFTFPDGVSPKGDPNVPIIFHYADFRLGDQTPETDILGHQLFKLPAYGLSYDIRGTASADIINAGAGHDIVYGGAGNDSLNGGLGDDTLSSGEGADTIDGGTGNNTVSYANPPEDKSLGSTMPSAGIVVSLEKNAQNTGGDAANDVLINIQNVIGSDFNDRITGNEHNNNLDGGNGNDTLEGGLGADTLNGGAENDTVSYIHAIGTGNRGVTVSLQTPEKSNDGEALGDVFISIENIEGSNKDDLLIGDANNNILSGMDGDDTLIGGLGADSLDGGAGNNFVSYSNAAINSIGVTVVASLADPQNNAGDAKGDTYKDIQNLIGSDGNDLLQGNAAANVLNGGDGDDTLIATLGGNDTLIGGRGYDAADYHDFSSNLNVDLNTGIAQTGSQVDTLENIENILGGSGGDLIVGDSFSNAIQSLSGNDTLIGGKGADTLDGGNGIDTVDYTDSEAVAVSLAKDAQAKNSGGAVGDVLINIEQIIGSKYNDQITGDENPNTLSGGLGDDTLDGGAGSNVIDALDGGAGEDTVSYASALQGLTVSLDDPSVNTFEAKGDVYISIENIQGSAFNDTLIARKEGSVLTGGVGKDTLIGGVGLDTASYSTSSKGLFLSILHPEKNGAMVPISDADGDVYDSIEKIIGSNYNDTIEGGVAYDKANQLINYTFDGAKGIDTVTYASSTKPVTVDLASNKNAGGAEGNYLLNIENIIGTTGNDLLLGSDSVNTLSGGNGDDTLQGGLGGDSLDGGVGNDWVSYNLASSGVKVYLDNSTANTSAYAQGDSYKSIENIEGTSFNDLLNGDKGDNILVGGLGTDTLIGGEGQDFASYKTYVSKDGVQGLSVSLLDPSKNTGDAAGDSYQFIEGVIGSDYKDTLEGTAGSDTIDGRDGIDIVSYASSQVALTIDLQSPNNSTGNAKGDVYLNIEKFEGSAFNDTFIGDKNNNIFIGGLGADTLNGGAGDDHGSDTASYDTAKESVNVALTSTPLFDNSGDAKGDVFINIDNIIGSPFDDKLLGDDNLNSIDGGSGNDIIYASGGSDTINGGDGIDTVSYEIFSDPLTVRLTDIKDSHGKTVDGPGSVTKTSTGDIDTLTNVENIVGGLGNDTFIGNILNNKLQGGGGDDTLTGGGGSDSLDGGEGVNTASYDTYVSKNLTGLFVSLRPEDKNINTYDANGDVFINIQNLKGTKYSDTLSGDESNNIIDGADGNDTLYGWGGEDTLIGGKGADTLIGGESTNTASYSTALTSVTASLLNPSLNKGDAQGDTYKLIQNLIGSNYGDSLIGDSGSNLIDGGRGDDTLDGGGGGNDAFIGGDGFDTVTYAGSYYSNGITASFKPMTGVDYIDSFIEKIIGSSGNDTLYGGDNSETIVAGQGNDIIYGSAGGDIIDGGNGIDTVSYVDSNQAVSVNLSLASSPQKGGYAEGDILTSIENIIGGSYNDTLRGGQSDDTLSGGKGDDSIYAGTGHNQMNGDDGNDTFIVDAGQNTIDGGSGNDTFTLNAGSNTVIGGLGNDNFTINSGTNNLDGGTGNDTFNVSGGSNTLSGGDGDDVFIVSQSLLTSLPIDGGSNTQTSKTGSALGDVLQLNASSGATLKLSDLVGNVKNIETVDLSKDNASTNLEITSTAIRSLVNSGNNSNLQIKLGAGDTYSISLANNETSSTQLDSAGHALTSISANGIEMATFHII